MDSIEGVHAFCDKLRKGGEPTKRVTLFAFADYFPAVATTDLLSRVADVLACKAMSPWDGMEWHAMPCHAMTCHAMPWQCHGMAWHGMVWPWHGMAWHGMEWNVIAWHGMAWHGMECHCME